jgi:hypothetical protein
LEGRSLKLGSRVLRGRQRLDDLEKRRFIAPLDAIEIWKKVVQLRFVLHRAVTASLRMTELMSR